jgi:hypothetical protein
MGSNRIIDIATRFENADENDLGFGHGEHHRQSPLKADDAQSGADVIAKCSALSGKIEALTIVKHAIQIAKRDLLSGCIADMFENSA